MNILAIGGGDKSLPVRQTLDSLPSAHAHVLIVPSACSTETAYNRKLNACLNFFGSMGVSTSVLHEFRKAPTATQIAHELGAAALVYTIGGNTPHMLKTLRSHGTDIALTQAIQSGKPHAGTSAGAMLPFEAMHSNISARPTLEEWDYQLLPGLGIINAAITVHAEQHDQTMHGARADSRLEHLLQNFPPTQRFGVAIDNGAAIALGDENRITTTTQTARVNLLERIDPYTVSITEVDDAGMLDALKWPTPSS